MAVLSLPLSFTNSFWSQDYRKGIEVLFQKLEQGVLENDEIIAFIKARARAEAQLASSLVNPYPTGAYEKGFSADDGASLLMAFRGLQAESAAQGQVHKNISKELESLVVEPFDAWAQGYKERLKQSKVTVLDNWMKTYEHAQSDVAKLKYQYLTKTRKADEAEDDAKFAPTGSEAGDTYTTSPRTRPVDGRAPPQRTASVSERIAQRLKEIQKKSVHSLATGSDNTSEESPKAIFDAEPESEHPKVDKGKGKAVDSNPPTGMDSPPPMSPPLPPSKIEIPVSPMPPMPPPLMLLAGLSLPPIAISQLLSKAAEELNLRPVRFPLLGEYQDCFTGEELVTWLNENVQGFGGSLDRAEDAARELTEKEGLLRRVGEFGNLFENSDNAFYQFRQKAFDLESKRSDSMTSPIKPEAILKRTNNFMSLVSKALAANGTNGEPLYIKLQHEAQEADALYRTSIRRLDRQRLGLEERLEDTLKTLQRWETERLRAVKTVLLQYQGTLSNLPKSLEHSFERSTTLISAYQPDSDLIALIERYRTGPFRPDAQVYESVSHDESDVVFGIDLRKWAEGGWSAIVSGEESKDPMPPVLPAMINGLTESYKRLPNDTEKRKSWIYEVPLGAIHHLREALNSLPPNEPVPPEIFEKYDAPVIAATIKLWILELDPPLAMYEGWDEFRKLYPVVGAAAKTEDDNDEEQHFKDLCTALLRLPRVHLYALDAVVSHLKRLVDETSVDEENEVYFTKLALSLGRTVVRPKFETELSIQDRHPTLLFIELLKYYDKILPATIARKKRESERKLPVRKRTAMVDARLSRSKIQMQSGVDPKQLLAAQHAAQNPKATKSPEEPNAPLPIIAPTPVSATPLPPPPFEKPITPPPPPPPIFDPVALVAPAAPDVPPIPSFKEPPPEDDDLPPRPTFREPPPEPEDDSPPPRPKFVEPPAEVPDSPPATIPSATVAPPVTSEHRRIASKNSSPTMINSRSPSPGDVTLNAAKSTISRSTSGGVRGPRIARGPRPPAGSVSSMVSNLNRNSMAGSSPLASPTSPSYKRLSGSPSRRPSSIANRASLSRRTMASDAEDDIVEKK